MTIKNGRLDWAVWKPLGPQTEPPINPEVLIYHVIVGSLAAADSVFRSQGYTGDESTFGIGGPLDGSLDGVVWQWQDTRRQADAQFAGNAYANSAETSGFPNHPWSSKQLSSCVRLGADFCHAHPDRKPHLVNRSGPLGDGAFGYHELREDWNTDHHTCPGAVREGQFRTIVIPKIRATLLGQPIPTAPKPKPVPATHPSGDGKIVVDGVFGAETIGAMQHVLEAKAVYHETIDGIFGPHTRAGLQLYLQQLGLYHGTVDSLVGHETVTALQDHIGANADGLWGKSTTRTLQGCLNDGRF
jgi:hypothetical protein